MIRSAVTVSLVPEAQGGPFVFWHDLPAAIDDAAKLGFDAIELFAPGPDAIAPQALGTMLKNAGLRLAAVGTGAGWVRHKLTLTDPNPTQRTDAQNFVRQMIDFGAEAGIEAAGSDAAAPAIIGSMQGRWSPENPRDDALGRLTESLNILGEHAQSRQSRLLYEPLNRYETNLVNTLADGSRLLRGLTSQSVKLLADLFHMNIEEVDLATSLAHAGDDVGHVHFVDSNRRPPGCGHIDFAPVVRALQRNGYNGHLSAEALPCPDPHAAARQTINTFRRLFPDAQRRQ